MKGLCQKISSSEQFQRFILFLILVTAVTMGLEVVPAFNEAYGELFFVLDIAIQCIFVGEIAVRLLAHAPMRDFFRDRWNSFDFAIVAVSLVPTVGSFALIARLLRVLRILRFLSASDRLRSFMARLQEAGDEILYAFLIAAVMGYIFVVSGYYLFADIDPDRWGGLKEAFLSVFYLSLFQDVRTYVAPLAEHSLFSILFFLAFYLSLAGLALAVIAAAVRQGEERR